MNEEMEIFAEEVYPVYRLLPIVHRQIWGTYMEITPEFFDRYQKAMEEFEAVQTILEEVYDKTIRR